MVLHVSPSAVLIMRGSLKGPKATVKALTEKVYWVPGVRLDSTTIMLVVFKKRSDPEDDSCSS